MAQGPENGVVAEAPLPPGRGEDDALAAPFREAWRGPVEDAISSAFGDLDPESDDLVEQFSERVPKFLDSLPSALSGMDAAAFRKTLEGAMLASFVDGLMPASYWRKAARS